MQKRNRIFVMCFGLAGNHGEGVSADGNSYSTSWYLRGPDEFLECIPSHYKPSEVDGCIIIDKRAVLEERPGLAVTQPLVSAKLEGDEIDRLRERHPHIEDSIILQAMAHGDSQQRGLAALAVVCAHDTSDEPGAFDYVSPTRFARWWAKQGARVGILRCEPTPHIEWAQAA